MLSCQLEGLLFPRDRTGHRCSRETPIVFPPRMVSVLRGLGGAVFRISRVFGASEASVKSPGGHFLVLRPVQLVPGAIWGSMVTA